MYNKGTLNRFRSCYHKCLKIFFGYQRTDSVTNMLFTLKLPSFNTILHNGKQQFVLYVLRSGNNLIDTIRVLILVSYQCSVLCLSSFTVYFTMFVFMSSTVMFVIASVCLLSLIFVIIMDHVA